MTEQQLQAIKEGLRSFGWTILDSTAIARKFYKTAVGPKEALVYVTPGDEFNFTLTGAYYSEGRNILEPRFKLIPRDASVTRVAAIVDSFVFGVDKAIAESYAARLL